MTSDSLLLAGAREAADRAYVWVYLPGRTDPVVAGVLVGSANVFGGHRVLLFRYAESYLARPERYSLFTPELPLVDLVQDPRVAAGREPLALASSLRDAAPDAWGRRVINVQLEGTPERDLSELTYLLASGSDRIGALDFQSSPTVYRADTEQVPLSELAAAASRVESGRPVPPELAAALLHGTSIGGARPKALLYEGGRSLIAKFSASTDVRPVVQAEAVAMLLAERAGLRVAPVSVVEVDGRQVLLVERFDRCPIEGDDSSTQPPSSRRQMVSMLTVLGLSETSARYGSYVDLARHIRSGPWQRIPETLAELFGRLVVNICVGNTDDHLRNHAAFWDGATLELTPAYDIAPQPRTTSTASQAIGILDHARRASQLRLARHAAAEFLLSPVQAEQIIDRVRGAIIHGFENACDQALLTVAARRQLWGREFCNPYIDYDHA